MNEVIFPVPLFGRVRLTDFSAVRLIWAGEKVRLDDGWRTEKESFFETPCPSEELAVIVIEELPRDALFRTRIVRLSQRELPDGMAEFQTDAEPVQLEASVMFERIENPDGRETERVTFSEFLKARTDAFR